MIVERLPIADVLVIVPDRISDARGSFCESFNLRRFASETGVDPGELQFVQDNESHSVSTGTLRGLHFQAPPFAQAKLVRVLSGSIFDVAVDFRRNSPTFGRWVSSRLSAMEGQQMWVPPGFLHGFLTLEPDTRVAYKVTAYYDAASDGAVRWSDPSLNIEWPLEGAEPILSAKDAAAPLLAEIASPF